MPERLIGRDDSISVLPEIKKDHSDSNPMMKKPQELFTNLGVYSISDDLIAQSNIGYRPQKYFLNKNYQSRPHFLLAYERDSSCHEVN